MNARQVTDRYPVVRRKFRRSLDLPTGSAVRITRRPLPDGLDHTEARGNRVRRVEGNPKRSEGAAVDTRYAPDMAVRPCLDCGRLGYWSRSGRCDDCRLSRQRRKDRAPTRKALKAKYDHAHERLRANWAPIVAAGGVICPRCRSVIVGPFDLGHQANGKPSRPEHPSCNRSAH